MEISGIGEFGLIDLFQDILKREKKDLVTGPGDDCAVFDISPGFSLVASTDAMIENVHFSKTALKNPYQLGRKAAAVNLSDIAAMGAVPLWLLVSMSFPDNTPISTATEITRGIEDLSQKYNASIIGGNLAKDNSKISIHIFVLGKIEKGKALLRKNAEPGDLILVSGSPGQSAAGLGLILNPQTSLDKNTKEHLIMAHENPVPRIELGRILSQNNLATSCLDISDGLLSDLSHILKASQVGALINTGKIPLSACLKRAAKALNRDPLDFALTGGEDYELLFTLPEQRFQDLKKFSSAENIPQISVIGKIKSKEFGLKVFSENREIFPLKKGWNHFNQKT